RLPEEQTRVPIPAWIPKFQAAYSSNMLIGSFMALLSPRRALAIEAADGPRVTYFALVKNFLVALVPFALIAGTLWAAWWYVVIHQQVAPADAVAPAVQQLGTPDIATGSATPAEQGPPDAFYLWYWIFVAAGAVVL